MGEAAEKEISHGTASRTGGGGGEKKKAPFGQKERKKKL